MNRLHKVLACSILLALVISDVSVSFVYSSYQIPFEGMQLLYYSETTPVLLQQAKLSGAEWINLAFHDLTANSSKMDVNVSGNVTENGQQLPINVNSTTDFPMDRDTLLYLRNGGQQSIEIYAGAAGQAIQILPGFSLQLSRTWDLHDQTLVKNSLGNFPAYRYHTSLNYGGLVLDFYASYEKSTQVLVYGEVYATQGGGSVLVDKLELRRTNVQFQGSAQSQSSQCIIATAAYGSELASPVQFLRNFRDDEVNKTFLGHQFLSAFNAWYYSWAPAIAKVESNNPALRSSIRVIILPLLGTLYLSSAIFNALRFVNPEMAIFISGIVASSLLGLIYIWPVAIIARYSSKRMYGRRAIAYVSAAAFLFALVGTLTHGATGLVEIVTSIIVMEAILLPTAFLLTDFKGLELNADPTNINGS